MVAMWCRFYLHELNFTKPRFETLVREGVSHGRASTRFDFSKNFFQVISSWLN
jgi:hypothetical protein